MLLQLEKFSIVLYTVFFPTSKPMGLIQNTLLPFLNDHSLTLRSLKFHALEKVDISSILAGLQHMPCLNSLNISHHFLSLGLMSLVSHQFLEAHQSQLQHLTFNFVAHSPSSDITNEFFNQEWCRILFPELQSLLFGLWFLRLTVLVFREDAAITYIQQHVLTVKSLQVSVLTFSYDQVASILTGLKGGEYRLTKLETLNLQIWCFSLALLSLLAENTP